MKALLRVEVLNAEEGVDLSVARTQDRAVEAIVVERLKV
jgi:hypothetical protein